MNREKTFTKDEENLLMFLEYTAVDQWGWIDDMSKLNQDDLEIMKRWNEEEFIFYKRASRHRDTSPAGSEGIQLTYVVKLSDKAWKLAHKFRKEKALRHIPEKLNL